MGKCARKRVVNGRRSMKESLVKTHQAGGDVVRRRRIGLVSNGEISDEAIAGPRGEVQIRTMGDDMVGAKVRVGKKRNGAGGPGRDGTVPQGLFIGDAEIWPLGKEHGLNAECAA